MANHEQESDRSDLDQDIIDVLAEYRLGKIDREKMSENDKFVLSYYLGVMVEDPKFSAKVKRRQEEIKLLEKEVSEKDREVSLHTEENSNKSNFIGKRRNKVDTTLQPPLWEESVNSSTHTFECVYDPEEKMFKEMEKLNKPYIPAGLVVGEECKKIRTELRKEINLPIVRGKDPNVGNPVYKFLVRHVCTQDTFGIFRESYSVMGKRPPELDAKIEEVKGLISDVLDPKLNRLEKYRIFNNFVASHKDIWRLD